MTLALEPKPLRWILPVTMTILIGCLTLTWIPVTTLGSFDLRLPYVFAIVLGALLCLFPARFAIGLRYLPPALAPWLVAYMFYLLVLTISLAGVESEGIVPRQIFFLLCGCTFAFGIVAIGANARVLRIGGLLAIIGFLAVVEVLARQINLSWTIAIEHFVTTGDLEFIFYHFLKELFQLVAPVGARAQASDKNIISVSILTALFLFRAGHSTRGSDRLGQLVTLLALFILVLLNTRSVLLIALIGLPLAGWISAIRNGVHSSGEFILKSVFFFGMMIAVVLIFSLDSAAISMIEDRFSFSDDSSGDRFLQYTWAMQRIETHPFRGAGLAEFNGQMVHNLFLGAWMHAGLLAFLLVAFTYASVMFGWIIFVVRVVTQPGYWVLPVRAEWVALLPVLPLFRVWIAGDAGHPSFVEWTALCAFFSLSLTNRLTRQGIYDGPLEETWVQRFNTAETR